MELSLQQRVCIKFCVKNGFNGARTLEMLEKCFGNDTLKKTVVYQWHERFRSGRELVDDDERSGRPSTSKTDKNIDKVREMLANNGKLTIRELAEDLNIAYGSVQAILVNDLVRPKKNITKNVLGTTMGRVHIRPQRIDRLQTRKLKGLRKTAEERKAERALLVKKRGVAKAGGKRGSSSNTGRTAKKTRQS